jgi:tRNA dimethylallyltransferase
MDRPAILLMGPTASGKSALAMQLASRLPVEIVSVDSAQVYRGMDVGTAKPGAEDRARVAHHLVDVIDPTESYSAAQFRADALKLIDEIRARGRLPLLVGGTMLYFKALLEGLSDLPSSDPAVRAEIDARAAERGWPAMHAELTKVDATTAARLAPNDGQRIQRALEIYRVSGRPMSALIGGAREAPSFRAVSVGLVPSDRAVLHRRIQARFEAILANGLVDELRGLRRRYALQPGLPSMRCVRYRQAWRFLEGELNEAGLRDRGVFATRQLAKRQLTWLRSMPGVETFDCLDPEVDRPALEFLSRAIASA